MDYKSLYRSGALKRAIVIGAAAVVAGILLLFAFYAYPAPGQDSSVFLPLAINLAKGKGMVNEVHHFLYPAPLFPLIISWLMWAPTPQSALAVAGVFAALNIILSAFLFYRVATLREQRLTWFRALLIVMSLAGLATYFGYGQARPELFASFLLLIACCVTFYWNDSWSANWLWGGYGVTLGVMGAAHPNGALLFALLVGAFCSALFSMREAVVKLAWVYGVPLSGLGLLALVSPDRAAGMMGGVYDVGMRLLTPNFLFSSQYSLINYYIVQPNAFFFGAVYLIAIIGTLHLGYRYRRRIAAPVFFAGFVSLLLFIVYVTAIRTPNRNYNLLLFAPLFFAFNIYYLKYLTSDFARAVDLRYMPGVVRVGYVAVLALTTLGFLRNVALFPIYLQDGMTLPEARAAIAELGVLDESDSEVRVTKSLWTLTERYDRIYFCPPPRKCANKADWLIVQQRDSGGATPPKKAGERQLVYDCFVHQTPRLLGIKLANSMRGYSFAVYARQQSTLGTAQKRLPPGCVGVNVD